MVSKDARLTCLDTIMNVTTQISPISTLQMHIITKFNCYNRWMFMRFLCLKTDPVTSDSNYWLLAAGAGEGEAGAGRGGYPLSTDLMIKFSK